MEKLKTTSKLPFYASLCGVVGPAVMAAGMLLSAFVYSGKQGQAYSLLNHFVSELGELGVSDLAVVFNWGLIIGGSLSAIFMIFLAAQIKSWIKYPLGLLSVVATVSGALVGVYPMNFLGPHIRVAMLFFNLGMIISLLYSLVFLFSKKHPFPKWLALPGLINAAAFTIFLNFPSEFDSADTGFQEGMRKLFVDRPDFIPLALMEWVVVLGILVWIILIAIYLLGYTRRKLSY